MLCLISLHKISYKTGLGKVQQTVSQQVSTIPRPVA